MSRVTAAGCPGLYTWDALSLKPQSCVQSLALSSALLWREEERQIPGGLWQRRTRDLSRARLRVRATRQTQAHTMYVTQAQKIKQLGTWTAALQHGAWPGARHSGSRPSSRGRQEGGLWGLLGCWTHLHSRWSAIAEEASEGAQPVAGCHFGLCIHGFQRCLGVLDGCELRSPRMTCAVRFCYIRS